MNGVKAVVDTNVVISGIFWKGTPYLVLQAWLNGAFLPLLSPEVIDEYRRVLETMCSAKKMTAPFQILEVLLAKAAVIHTRPLPERVCDDADDDKFLGLAAAGGANYLVSGDRALLRVKEYAGCRVVVGREFLRLL